MIRVDEVVSGMVCENERRIKARAFDPVTGLGSPGMRVKVQMNCSVLGGGVFYLPKSMGESELGRSVIKYGSISRFARERGLTEGAAGELFELVRLSHDFPYWASKYGLIRPKKGGENVPLILNAAQRKLIDLLESMRTAGKPIRAILLKARQWGGSTVIQLYMVWHQLVLSTGLNSLTVAHQNAATEEIRGMMKRVVDEYPEELMRVDFEAVERGLRRDRNDSGTVLKPVGRSGNAWTLPVRNCDFKIGTAERPDSSRGGSYSLIHLSEVGIWRSTDGRKPAEIVVSATSGVLASPGTMIILESTAKGKGTFFHKEYKAAGEGKAQWMPVFIAWYDIEQYTLPLTDKESFARRLYEGRESEEKTERSESGHYLWKLWERGATLEAINWYIWERRKYDSSSAMASEYPSDDVEAFASSGSPLFSAVDLEKLGRQVTEPETRNFGRLKIETWSDFSPEREYVGVMSVGGVEIGERTTAVIADISNHEGPRIVAQLSGEVTPREAVRTVCYLCGIYGECQLALVSDRSNLIGTGHTLYASRLLSDTNQYLYPCSKNSVVYELDERERIMIMDSLSELIATGQWNDPSKESLSQIETIEADRTSGFYASPGATLDLVMPRALIAHIVSREMKRRYRHEE